jgi:hypothetical protein
MAAFVGALLLGLNVVSMLKGGFFFPFVTMLGCALLFAGSFGAVVGEPDDPYGNRPMWFKVGVAACAITGLLAGLLLNIELAA